MQTFLSCMTTLRCLLGKRLSGMGTIFRTQDRCGQLHSCFLGTHRRGLEGACISSVPRQVGDDVL